VLLFFFQFWKAFLPLSVPRTQNPNHCPRAAFVSLCIQETGVRLVQKLPYLKSEMSESRRAFLQASRCPVCNGLAKRHHPTPELLLHG